MIKEVNDFKRKDTFDYFNSKDNAFVIVTTKIDVTNIVNYCKKNRYFYSAFGYLITKTVNSIDSFKYRYKDNKIYYCDKVNTSYTEMIEDDNIGFFDVEYNENFLEYRNNYLDIREEFFKTKKSLSTSPMDLIWVSCVPWFKFTSLIPPFKNEEAVPQFIWDKYEIENGRYYVNLMIMAHHGFTDGYHIGKFIELLNSNITKFGEEYLCII